MVEGCFFCLNRVFAYFGNDFICKKSVIIIFVNLKTTSCFQPLKPIENETFVDWFTRNKTMLEQQNPELSPSELTRHGIKQFKTLQGKPTNSDNGPKRKLDDGTNGTETPVSSAPKQSKLSAFAFSKKT